jgi:hypothetical protein
MSSTRNVSLCFFGWLKTAGLHTGDSGKGQDRPSKTSVRVGIAPSRERMKRTPMSQRTFSFTI